MNITLPSHTENALRDIAARARQPPELYVREIIIRHLREVADSPFSEVDEDVDPTAFDRAMARMKARTPADIAQARTRLLAQVPPPRALPPGQDIFDAICGQWPGDESDAEVLAALEKLS